MSYYVPSCLLSMIKCKYECPCGRQPSKFNQGGEQIIKIYCFECLVEFLSLMNKKDIFQNGVCSGCRDMEKKPVKFGVCKKCLMDFHENMLSFIEEGIIE